jgi:single-strand DNA-binding protein
MDLNQIALAGKVGSPPQYRENGTMAECSFVLGTAKDRKTIWHKVVTWGRLARACKDQVRKGDHIFVFGYINYRETESQGLKRMAFEITALEIGFDLRVFGVA